LQIDAILRAHPVRGEIRIPRHADPEFATKLRTFPEDLLSLCSTLIFMEQYNNNYFVVVDGTFDFYILHNMKGVADTQGF